MSAPTVQALATSIYDALDESGILRELDNEQVWAVAELAAQTIEAAGTPKAIIRAWLTEQEMTAGALSKVTSIYHGDSETRRRINCWGDAIREVSS